MESSTGMQEMPSGQERLWRRIVSLRVARIRADACNTVVSLSRIQHGECCLQRVTHIGQPILLARFKAL